MTSLTKNEEIFLVRSLPSNELPHHTSVSMKEAAGHYPPPAADRVGLIGWQECSNNFFFPRTGERHLLIVLTMAVNHLLIWLSRFQLIFRDSTLRAVTING